jgi:hypothetical protein
MWLVIWSKVQSSWIAIAKSMSLSLSLADGVRILFCTGVNLIVCKTRKEIRKELFRMHFVTRLAYHNNGEIITEMAPAQCLGCVFSLHLFIDEPRSEQLPLSSAVASHVGSQPTNPPVPFQAHHFHPLFRTVLFDLPQGTNLKNSSFPLALWRPSFPCQQGMISQ